MSIGHLSEDQLQQYAADPSVGEPAIREHLAGCEHCRVKAANYRLLFAGLIELERPALAFDPERLVMEKVGQAYRLKVWAWIPITLIATLTAGGLGAIAWLNKDWMSVAFKGLSAGLTGVALAVFMSVLVLQLLSFQKEHGRQMRELDTYPV